MEMNHPTTDVSENRLTQKEIAWQAWRESWNQKGSMDYLTPLGERTARNYFEEWWERNHE